MSFSLLFNSHVRMIQSLKSNLIESFSINYRIHFLISAVNCIQMILIDKTYIVHVLLICADWMIFFGGGVDKKSLLILPLNVSQSSVCLFIQYKKWFSAFYSESNFYVHYVLLTSIGGGCFFSFFIL